MNKLSHPSSSSRPARKLNFRFASAPFTSSHRSSTAVVALIALAGLSRTAFAESSPAVSLTLKSDSGTPASLSGLTNFLVYNGTEWTIDTTKTLGGQWTSTMMGVLDSTGQAQMQAGVQWTNLNQSDALSDISFSIKGNTDPILSYGLAVTNNTASVQNYSFVFGEAIAPPVTGAYNIYADIAGSITNRVTGSAIQIAPTTGSFVQTVKFSTDGGITFLPAGVDVGPLLNGNPMGSTSYGLFQSGPFSASTLSSINYWEIETDFSLTPGGDSVVLSGYSELTAIPEPSTTAAILGGVVLLSVVLGRRKLRPNAV